MIGNSFAFCHHHLRYLHLENFLHRQPPLEDTQSDSGNFSDGKMDPQQIVHHPVYASQPLQAGGGVGIPIGLASTGGTFAAQGTQERFGMLGMDSRLGNGTSCCRMFRPWTLLWRPLAPFFRHLGTFLLDSDVPPAFASLLRSSWLAMVPQGITALQEQSARAALTIRKETQIVGLSRHRVSRLDPLVQERALLLAPLARPQEAPGSIHAEESPPR